MNHTVREILDDVLKREGWPEYTEHPLDRGGPTKGGITLQTLEDFLGKPCTRRELMDLERDTAINILIRRYVRQNGIQLLVREPIAPQLVDNAVLSGPRLAVKDLQRVLGVPADGIIGPHTVAAYTPTARVTNQLAITRALRLARHVQKHPDQLVFLGGWLARCLRFIDRED